MEAEILYENMCVIKRRVADKTTVYLFYRSDFRNFHHKIKCSEIYIHFV